ncbi:MAG: peptidoglycan DD-metalloendopeptidase family protein [Dermatophilaceae bacterium]
MPSPSTVIIALVVASSAMAGSAAVSTAFAAGPQRTPLAAAGGVDINAPDPGRASRPGSAPVWSWPLSPRPPVIRQFVAPRSEYGPGHRGLDLGGSGGLEVRAVNDGIVLHAGRVAGRGTVTVRHGSGLESTYEPLEVQVSSGDQVSTGEPLGVLSGSVPGSAHCGSAVCLHLGARRSGTYLDPLPLLTGGRVVLLPLTGTATTTVTRPATGARRSNSVTMRRARAGGPNGASGAWRRRAPP